MGVMKALATRRVLTGVKLVHPHVGRMVDKNTTRRRIEMMARDEIETATREQLAEELGAACEPTEDWETADASDLRERVTALADTESEG
jgi:hypothetical protein